MRRLLKLSALAVCATAWWPIAAAPAAESTLLTPLARPTSVSHDAGWTLFSRWDGTAYHLATLHDGQVRDLAVPSQAVPFDADAGPDSHGHPSAVFSRCLGDCDLYVIGFAVGDRPRPVRNANTSGRDEIAPSVWKGRLVFGRRFSRDQVVPYTKLLAAPRARPSRRLAGLPDRRCGAVIGPSCRKIKHVSLQRMDLWGRWVGQSWTYHPDDFAGHRQDEIRLTTTDRSVTRQLAYRTTGEGGQTYLGPSLVSGYVGFASVCHGDPGGCRAARDGVIRYRISTGDYGLDGDVRAWEGWSFGDAASVDLHVPSAFDCSGGDPGAAPTEPCGIHRRSGLRYRAIAASALR